MEPIYEEGHLFTIPELEDNFDNIMSQVGDDGKTFLIEHDGNKFVLAPYTEDMDRLYKNRSHG